MKNCPSCTNFRAGDLKGYLEAITNPVKDCCGPCRIFYKALDTQIVKLQREAFNAGVNWNMKQAAVEPKLTDELIITN
jgi:hypothetical protein